MAQFQLPGFGWNHNPAFQIGETELGKKCGTANNSKMTLTRTVGIGLDEYIIFRLSSN